MQTMKTDYGLQHDNVNNYTYKLLKIMLMGEIRCKIYNVESTRNHERL